MSVPHLIIFDWDDTLLPSSWLLANKDFFEPSQMRLVAEHVKTTLELARTVGSVLIVTNAEKGWVESSCAKYLPHLQSTIEKIRLLSARALYSSDANPFSWKKRAFEQEIRELSSRLPDRRRLPNTVVSIGDSCHERYALMAIREHVKHVKSIKLLESPSLDQLVQQHKVFQNAFDAIMACDQDMDLCMLINQRHIAS